MPSLIKGFLFDLDGTLVNTEEANFEAYKKAILDICNFSITMQDFNKTKGMGYKEFLPLLVKKINDVDIEKVSKRKKIIYAELIHLTKANSFLIEFLHQMSEYHVTGLVTTAKKDNAQNVLKEHGLLNIFDFIIYGDDVENAKPHPEAYKKALESSGLKPEEVIAFEDSRAGLLAAKQAGISTIHIRSFL